MPVRIARLACPRYACAQFATTFRVLAALGMRRAFAVLATRSATLETRMTHDSCNHARHDTVHGYAAGWLRAGRTDGACRGADRRIGGGGRREGRRGNRGCR